MDQRKKRVFLLLLHLLGRSGHIRGRLYFSIFFFFIYRPIRDEFERELYRRPGSICIPYSLSLSFFFFFFLIFVIQFFKNLILLFSLPIYLIDSVKDIVTLKILKFKYNIIFIDLININYEILTIINLLKKIISLNFKVKILLIVLNKTNWKIW